MRSDKAKANMDCLLTKPTISPDELYDSGVIPIGRNGIYDACNSFLNSPQSGTGIECFRVNKKIVIPTAPLRRKLGLAPVEAA